MARTTAYTRNAPAIEPGSDEEPDLGAAAQQRVLRTAANGTPPPATSAAPSIFALAKAAKPKRAASGARLPPLDVSALTFESGVPLISRVSTPGANKYSAVFAGLVAPGMSVVIPVSHAGTVSSVAVKLNKAGKGRYTVRRIGDGKARLYRLE